ncbi:nickel pincer cofactor biosynthesis protein LarB [bacterium]|nr:nickel pincer cofactor biosynthesis protein LarB [bacterium]
MSDHSLEAILSAWREGQLSTTAVESQLRQRYATTAEGQDVLLDLDRQRRCGFPEVVYGQGKSLEQLRTILEMQQQAGQPSLITRCDAAHAAVLAETFPAASYQPLARTFRVGQLTAAGLPHVLVVTAGATDRPIAEEACETAIWMGCKVETLSDVGVAGPWRLIERRERLQQADAVVCVAGMEGALPSIVAGWVSCPVIAVPTSVGYGSNLQGLAPLLSMLNSCAANVAVVNIDAGFKGGYMAGMIARQVARGREG